MTQTVYGDILFLIDFSMDFLSLYVCGRICSAGMRLSRLCAAASLGALFSVAVLFLSPHRALRLLSALLLAAAMCATAFGRRRILRNCAIYCFVSFAMSGTVTALLSLFGRLDPGYGVLIYGNVKSVRPEIPVHLLLISAAVSAALAVMLGSVFRKQTGKKTVTVNCVFGGRSAILDGFVDSGNLLCEPLSGMPCVIVKANKLKGVLPEEMFSFIKKGVFGEGPRNFSGLRAVPMSGAGGSGIMFAVRPDSLSVDGCLFGGYLALDMTAGDFGGHDALVPETMI